MLLDTGATKTIIRPDKLDKFKQVLPTKWKLRTATGDLAVIHGEVDVNLTIGNITIRHRTLVADIQDELILGMDIMNTKGFELDFIRGVLKINGEEIVLHQKCEETVRVILADDVLIPERCEMVLGALFEQEVKNGSILVFEPWIHDNKVGRGIMLGKSLLLAKNEVPIRVMNVSNHTVCMRKGTVLGCCSPVSSIIQKVSTGEPFQRRPKELVW